MVCFCRLKDTCIIVAVEEMPDEGLDQPLRLDKLANEVLFFVKQFQVARNQPTMKGRWLLPMHMEERKSSVRNR